MKGSQYSEFVYSVLFLCYWMMDFIMQNLCNGVDWN